MKKPAGLDEALALAVRAHAGQQDKVGRPYILHPLRVMLRLETERAMPVAALHDVVEDSDVTLADLRAMGFAKAIIEAVDCLTKRPGESYAARIERAAANPLARQVKIADLEDNMQLRRQHGLVKHDRARMARYAKAYRRLTGRDAP